MQGSAFSTLEHKLRGRSGALMVLNEAQFVLKPTGQSPKQLAFRDLQKCIFFEFREKISSRFEGP